LEGEEHCQGVLSAASLLLFFKKLPSKKRSKPPRTKEKIGFKLKDELSFFLSEGEMRGRY